MSLFEVPDWIKPHLFIDKNYSDLTLEELENLKKQIQKFQEEEPEISVVIPAWNEENNIFRTLSSLAHNTTQHKVEIVVVNNNSTDNTQKVLDELGVRNYFETQQGIAFARTKGLEMARGKFLLTADSDTFYPPYWMDTMVKPMQRDSTIVGVYGRYAMMPPEGQGRLGLWFYERITGVIIQFRKKNREHLNTLGFNMGFVTELGRKVEGYKVRKARVFNNSADSESYTYESEDGLMAFKLKQIGKLQLVLDPKAVVFTSARRLIQEGGIWKSFVDRVKMHGGRIGEYITGKSKPWE